MTERHKSLQDISWNVTEPEYRKDPALSYSTLARYEREGFNNLDKLFDRIETPSLVFGSAVDTLITGSQEEFDSLFMVATFPAVSDSIVKIVKSLFQQCGSEYNSIIAIPDSIIIAETQEQSYQLNWKPETRAKVIKEKGEEYYNLLFLTNGRTIIDSNTYQEVLSTVKALKTSPSTKFYFEEDSPFKPEIERLYQLKFKGEFEGIPYRIMADLIIVNHKEKWIKPVDLKTSSSSEWDFYKSFINWKYDIQARLYWAIIRQNLDKDEYFKDFTLLDYEFVVVNRNTLTPLVWCCPFTRAEGTIQLGKNNQIELRSPFEIGKELTQYLNHQPKTPNGIYIDKSNDLREWLNKF